jgi:NAD+ synthase
MQVYAMSEWRNSHVPSGALGPSGEVIPLNIISKAPSAELRENQTDQDSLPPYPVLDDILECLVENEMSNTEIAARGHPLETVQRIEHLLISLSTSAGNRHPVSKLPRRISGAIADTL